VGGGGADARESKARGGGMHTRNLVTSVTACIVCEHEDQIRIWDAEAVDGAAHP
jgi:hypothetical protein